VDVEDLREKKGKVDFATAQRGLGKTEED